MSGNDLQKFVGLLTSRLAEGEHLTSSGFVGDPLKQPDSSWAAKPVHFSNGRWLVKGAAEWSRYITVAAFRPDPSTGRIVRQMEFYAGTVAFMVDDIGTKIDAAALAAVHPTVKIETSPGNFQYWYVFKDLCRSKTLMDVLVDEFVKKFAGGVDPGMKGITRIGRVPESTNAKAAYGPNGWPVRMVSFHPQLANYTPELLANKWELKLVMPVKPKPKTIGTTIQDMRLIVFNAVKARLLLKENQPNRRDWTAVVCPWVMEHTGGASTGSHIHEPSAANDWHGGFKCHHGHCQDRRWRDVEDHVLDVEANFEADFKRINAETFISLEYFEND